MYLFIYCLSAVYESDVSCNRVVHSSSSKNIVIVLSLITQLIDQNTKIIIKPYTPHYLLVITYYTVINQNTNIISIQSRHGNNMCSVLV